MNEIGFGAQQQLQYERAIDRGADLIKAFKGQSAKAVAIMEFFGYPEDIIIECQNKVAALNLQQHEAVKEQLKQRKKGK